MPLDLIQSPEPDAEAASKWQLAFSPFSDRSWEAAAAHDSHQHDASTSSSGGASDGMATSGGKSSAGSE